MRCSHTDIFHDKPGASEIQRKTRNNGDPGEARSKRKREIDREKETDGDRQNDTARLRQTDRESHTEGARLTVTD